MALIAWRGHLWAGQDAFAFLWRRAHTNNKSFSHHRSSSVAVFLTDHLAAALLKKKFWIFPAVRDQRWCRPSTRRLQVDRDHFHFHRGGGGLYSRESAYSKISPLPSLGHVYCWKSGGLFSGGYGIYTGILFFCALCIMWPCMLISC